MGAYLDHAATTPVREAALEAMAPFHRERFANPSGAHAPARDARRAVDEAREVLAVLLGADPSEVVFTSGGTEADNLAVYGVTRRTGGVAVCPATEHHAVLDPVEHLGGRVVAVDRRGRVDLDALADALDEDVALVSVMLANNEVGTIQPLDEVTAVVRDRAPGAHLHTDAVQGFAWLDVAERCAPADLISISAHKFGGPKGVGALVVRDGTPLEPLVRGGGQEHGRRSGTHNVAGIVGMAAAAAEAASERDDAVARVGPLRDRLLDGLLAAIPDAVETGGQGPAERPDRGDRIAATAHLCIPGIESEALLFLLERDEVWASAASSCSSGAIQVSHVLAAMGVPKELAAGSLRLSLGHGTASEEVDRALDAVPRAVEQLRRFG